MVFRGGGGGGFVTRWLWRYKGLEVATAPVVFYVLLAICWFGVF